MIPDAADLIPELRAARAAAGTLLLGLDFDGTLAPIVPRPEDAALAPGLRPLLARLAARDDTRVALISGRGLRDLIARVRLDGLYYAGNHGLEIEGPSVTRVHEAAADARAALESLSRQLHAELAPIDGVIVEDKGLTLSVHYRLVDSAADAERVRQAVERHGRSTQSLRITSGKKVFEIRPDVDWDKGRALRFLRETLRASDGAAPAVFIGDDRTDEDAFRELGDRDFAIVVGDPPPQDTAARAFLGDTAAVSAFLSQLDAG